MKSARLILGLIAAVVIIAVLALVLRHDDNVEPQYTAKPAATAPATAPATRATVESLQKLIDKSYMSMRIAIEGISGNRWEEVTEADGAKSTIFHLGGASYVKLTHEQFELVHGLTLLDHWNERLETAKKDDYRAFLNEREELCMQVRIWMIEHGTPVDPNNLPPFLTKIERVRHQLAQQMQAK